MTIRRLFSTGAFERDLRRMKKQRKDLDKIEQIVKLLRENAVLAPSCRVYPVRGEWEGHWDCHVERDWILIYKLPRMGSACARGEHRTEGDPLP